jgi:subtilisin family serine protease
VKSRILACVAVFLAALPAVAQKRYIVRAPAKVVSSIATRHGLTVSHQYEAGGQWLALLTDYSGRDSVQVAAVIRSEAGVAASEPDRSVTVPEATSVFRLDQSTVAILDALGNRNLVPSYGGSVWASFLSQPATAIIGLAGAQSLATGSGVVAVIDTGVDPSHPALTGSLNPGYDFIRNLPGTPSELADLDQSTVAILDGSSVSLLNKSVAQVNQSTVAILDQSTVAILDSSKFPASFGHGTMVSSLVRLVAPTARIMPLKAFRADGTGSVYDVIRAVYYAVEAGARVINMSFSVDESSDELTAAISYANSRRVVCVASAGNAGRHVLVYPAALRKVEGVGSTSNTDTRSAFSNFGDDLVSLAAPGENLIAAWPGRNYAAASGTSFSTALVSGAAALFMQLEPNTNQSQAANALEQAKILPPADQLGAGRLDLYRACLYVTRH